MMKELKTEGNRDLMKQVQINFSRLSKGQKLIAEYILHHYEKAAFMTAAKLGEKVGVSESTVVRFADALGYDGYPKLQRALQELIKTKLTTVQRLEMSQDYVGKENIIKNVLKADIENVRATIEELNYDVFFESVNLLLNAKRIYVVGMRSSTTLAEYLGFYLNLILDNVKIVSQGVSDIFEQLMRVSKDDVVIGIGYPRYAQKTIDALSYAKDQGSKIISITDSLLSPIAGMADYTLIARSNMASFVDSLVAPMSLINAFVIAVGMQEKASITESFNKLENIWDRFHIYNVKEKGSIFE